MKKQEPPKGKPLTLPLIAFGAVVALFVVIATFISRGETSRTSTPATVATQPAPLSVLGGKIVFRCYKGGCSTPAHRGGCAGMEESKLDV